MYERVGDHKNGTFLGYFEGILGQSLKRLEILDSKYATILSYLGVLTLQKKGKINDNFSSATSGLKGFLHLCHYFFLLLHIA